jgi:ABC-type multidrug transport system ATPase subunit
MFDGTTDFDMRDIATYVEQDDALLGVLTVAETVTYAAKLRYDTTPHPIFSSSNHMFLQSSARHSPTEDISSGG